MIEFYVNGQKIDVQLEHEQTIGDILQSFEQTCEENNAAVIGITVNGKVITADIFDDEIKNRLTDNIKFEFTVVTVQEIKDSFIKLSELFTQLSEQMEKVPVELQNGHNQEVSQSINTLADSIEQFCHVATLASLFPDTFTNTKVNDMNFQDFFADLSNIMKDFEDALQNNDTVMIGDLSEYEICPRLRAISDSLKSM